MTAGHSTSVPPGPAQFPPTLWSIVLKAGGQPSAQAEQALAQLCSTYWYPIYAYLRRRGKTTHDAQDLTQGFFYHLLNKDALAKVRPEKGKFRSFLLTSLQNYLVDEWQRSQASKRGGGATVLSLDAEAAENRYACEPADAADPELFFEHRWAITLLETALSRLQDEQKSRRERFEKLQIFLTGEPHGVAYAEVAASLGMSGGAVKVAVLRLRQRYRELVRDEIAKTVADEREVDEEMRHLLTILRR
jgi:RNA polymerase sigma-70 factor (ECF subfamily)